MKVVKNTVIGLSMAAAFASYAAQDTANLNVSVSVTAACAIQSVNNTTWSTIDGNFITAANSSSGGVTVLCTNGTPYSIGLDNGQNYNGTSRTLSDGNSHSIAYGVYQDSGFTTAWGDIGSGSELTGSGSGSNQAATIYAQIPAGQAAVPAGNFSDVVVVTLDF
jgi:spore coat protein U-like protein